MAEPKIRFKEFEGLSCWENKRIEEICEILTGFPFEGQTIVNIGRNLLMRGINITEGVIRHSEEIDRYFDGDTSSLTKYRLKINDLVIGMDGSKVGKNSALVTKKEENALLVQRVVRLRTKNATLSYLILVSVGSDKFFSYVDGMKTSSAIPHISLTDIKKFTINIPQQREEQNALANYFRLLDNLIQSSEKKIASLRQVKAASLVSMFPQAGETKPRVRFKGFKGDWEKKKLLDIASFSKGRGYSKSDIVKNGTPLVLYGRLYTKYELSINNVDTYAYLKQGSVLSEGNEIIIPASGETAEDIAVASVVRQKNVILGGDLNIVKLLKDVPEFCALEITYGNAHNELVRVAQGKTVVHLHNSEICKKEIALPSLAEQKKIASFFCSLDICISLETQRLDKLKQIKSACLDKMFV